MEFILDDDYMIIVKKDDETNELVAELFSPENEFLERNRISKDDLYRVFFS